MNKLKRPLCWIKHHRWLLDRIQERPQDFEQGIKQYHYQCQRCGKRLVQPVREIK